MPLSKSKQNSFNKLILKFLFDCFSSLQQQSLLIYRPGLLKAFYSLFYIYESCFLLRNNNFFSVHTPAYRTRKDIKLRVIPFIGITSMNEFPRKNIRQAICLYIVLRNFKKIKFESEDEWYSPSKTFCEIYTQCKRYELWFSYLITTDVFRFLVSIGLETTLQGRYMASHWYLMS